MVSKSNMASTVESGFCPKCRRSQEVVPAEVQYPDDPMLEPEDLVIMADHNNLATGVRCDGVGEHPTMLGDESDLNWGMDDPDDGGDYGDEVVGFTTTLKADELKAPEGKFRLVLTDLVPMMVGGGNADYYHCGDFNTLEDATTECEMRKPEYGTSYIVYDDKGVNVKENSGIRDVSIIV